MIKLTWSTSRCVWQSLEIEFRTQNLHLSLSNIRPRTYIIYTILVILFSVQIVQSDNNFEDFIKIIFFPLDFVIQVSQLSSDFGWGVSVHYDAIKLNPRYRDFIRNNFEWATMEHRLKWPFIEKRQVKYIWISIKRT